MPPTTTSTSAATSRAAASAATSSSVALSSMNNSTGRPSRPPLALMSSMTIRVRFTLAMPMKDSAPVWSVMRPTRAGRSIGLVIVGPLCLVLTEKGGRLGLGDVAGGLEDRRDLGVGDELGPALRVPVEQHPHALVVRRVLEDRRALGAVNPALLSALGAEHVE